MKVYTAKTLFSGSVIGKDKELKLVGVPGGQNFESKSNYAKEKKGFKVEHEGKYMFIKNWHNNLGIRTFDDYSGRGNYKLAYFEWKPDQIDEIVSTDNALLKLAGTSEWEKLRAKLH